jgi:predicted RNA binding protein YcfA (HicA-like mRNA interferase family)
VPELPTLTPKEVISKLKKVGFVEDRQRGSHVILYHTETKKRAIVPLHLKDLPKG